ncbi:MAG: hypothetical protein FWB75_06575 [Oscillospiraceae bacterium]|nr:hypothetical protein [Oscillospiraceae bacterium]
MKKSAVTGIIVFVLWFAIWTIVRPTVDYLVWGVEINWMWSLITGSISGAVFTAIVLTMLHLTNSKICEVTGK